MPPAPTPSTRDGTERLVVSSHPLATAAGHDGGFAGGSDRRKDGHARLD